MAVNNTHTHIKYLFSLKFIIKPHKHDLTALFGLEFLFFCALYKLQDKLLNY